MNKIKNKIDNNKDFIEAKRKQMTQLSTEINAMMGDNGKLYDEFRALEQKFKLDSV